MNLKFFIMLVVAASFTAPASAVEAIFLDAVPVTNPGEYLAPPHFYMNVPPPVEQVNAVEPIIPTSVYNSDILKPKTTAIQTAAPALPRAKSADDEESEVSGETLKVFVSAGADHVSDVPLAVIKQQLKDVEGVQVVSENEAYDVLVEVETMRMDSAPVVFVVINAYKFVNDEQLIFYNTFGYLGDMKLHSGSEGYAAKLVTALQQEAERLDD